MATKTNKNLLFRGCLYKSGGRYYWKVRFPCEKKRKSIRLSACGEYSAKNRASAKIIAQRLWKSHVAKMFDKGGISIGTIGELVFVYSGHVETLYPNGSDMPKRISYALDFLSDLFSLSVDEFGSMRLREVRGKMLSGRTKISAKIVNERVGFIRKMFEWAASLEIVDPSVPYSLKLVENLTGRERGVKPAAERKPINIEIIKQTLPELTPTLRAMVRVQLFTGMRPGELLQMKPCQLDTSGDIWLYSPELHKNRWRGERYKRFVAIGKKAQEVLIPLIVGIGQNDYVFRPSDGMREAGKHGATGEHYTQASYRRAVVRACWRAFGRDSGCVWTPYQLRHTVATYIRKTLGDRGVSAAQVYLGQRSIDVAQIYARADGQLLFETARAVDSLEL